MSAAKEVYKFIDCRLDGDYRRVLYLSAKQIVVSDESNFLAPLIGFI